MSVLSNIVDQEEIVRKYFSNADKKICLKKGDVLLRQTEENNRIFYIHKGKLLGFLPDQHITEPVFEAHEKSFAGVYSYFSKLHRSYSQVVAGKDSEVYYFDSDPALLPTEESDALFGFLFKIVVLELRSRQQYAAQVAFERQDVLNKLIQTEKLATLGQLSAGLAHELNNTIGSLGANLRHLETSVSEMLKEQNSLKMLSYYERGKENGQRFSSAEARKQRANWHNAVRLDHQTLKTLTKAGIPPSEIASVQEAKKASQIWNLGFLFHDMRVAANQAAHVISSIRTMGVANQNWSKQVDVNKTIKEALAILRSLTRSINLELRLDKELGYIEACYGELVQIWINLIKNAIESHKQHKVENPTVKVSSTNRDDSIIIVVEDNGEGIAPAIMDKIYEPNFTTKVKGISLGLGLGLTIVQRIISEHDGELVLNSKPGCTQFKVILKKQFLKPNS